MKIKLCGIRRPDDIEYVNEFLPDYIGFVFAKSKRQVSLETAVKLESNLDSRIKKVGVFVNSPIDEVYQICSTAKLDVVQLHGDETPEYLQILKNKVQCKVWRAVRVKNAEDIISADKIGADLLLLDSFSSSAYGGTGKTANWDIINSIDIKTPFFLAGGLNYDNIPDAVNAVKPLGIDISGGIETNGFKNREKIKKIMKLLRSGHFE